MKIVPKEAVESVFISPRKGKRLKQNGVAEMSPL